MTLYHVNWCPDCEMVRQKLADLGLPYDDVIVPDLRPMRKQVYEVYGQYYVTVLTDGETVLSDIHEILAHIYTHYAKTPS